MAHGVPDQDFVYSFIFMPVDVASRGDGRPVDFGVPTYQLVGKPRDASETISRARTTA